MRGTDGLCADKNSSVHIALIAMIMRAFPFGNSAADLFRPRKALRRMFMSFGDKISFLVINRLDRHFADQFTLHRNQAEFIVLMAVGFRQCAHKFLHL